MESGTFFVHQVDLGIPDDLSVCSVRPEDNRTSGSCEFCVEANTTSCGLENSLRPKNSLRHLELNHVKEHGFRGFFTHVAWDSTTKLNSSLSRQSFASKITSERSGWTPLASHLVIVGTWSWSFLAFPGSIGQKLMAIWAPNLQLPGTQRTHHAQRTHAVASSAVPRGTAWRWMRHPLPSVGRTVR